MIDWTKTGKLRKDLLEEGEVIAVVAYLQEMERHHNASLLRHGELNEATRGMQYIQNQETYHLNCLSGIRWYLSQLREILGRIQRAGNPSVA